MPKQKMTLAEAIVERLAGLGVKRMFGVPGGGSSLDLIDAAATVGIDFVLTRGETSAALMAAVTGELTGTPGVALTGIGPGAASAVNGVAYASLERAPMLLFTDGRAIAPDKSPHQVFDQPALFRPITKDSGALRPDDGRGRFDEMIAATLSSPMGPAQIDLSSADSAMPVADFAASQAAATDQEKPSEQAMSAALAMIGKARRPVIVAGLEARDTAAAVGLTRLAHALGCAVLTSYKAKGAFPDSDPQCVGHFTGAEAERPCLADADLIIFYGLDPIEAVPGKWGYAAPLLALRRAAIAPGPIIGGAQTEVIGDLAMIAERLADAAVGSSWQPAEINGHRETMAARLRLGGVSGEATVETVVEALGEAAPAGCRLTVDAGAHMFSTMARWRAERPFGVLKSNGLSSMGFALPAAIASALEMPERPVAAVTGDGGMMMCLAELSTAARLGLRLVVVVINDAALSLIDIKQQGQQRPSLGVRYPRVDFAAAAEAMGCRGWRVGAGEPLAPALRAAFAADGPAVVDVACDASGYAAQLAALRG